MKGSEIHFCYGNRKYAEFRLGDLEGFVVLVKEVVMMFFGALSWEANPGASVVAFHGTVGFEVPCGAEHLGRHNSGRGQAGDVGIVFVCLDGLLLVFGMGTL